MFLTWVQSNTDPAFEVRHVPHFKGPDAVEDVKRHVGHLCSMAVAIPSRDSRGHHVGISNSLHLNPIKTEQRTCKHVQIGIYIFF